MRCALKKTLSQGDKPRFTLVKRGYAVDEVEEYSKQQHEQFEQLAREQRDRINALKERIRALEEELEHYRSREDEIKRSIVAATDKANEMTLDLKIQYALEIERLKIFQAKWTNAYEELKERYHFGKDALNMEAVVANTVTELEKMLHRDFSLDRMQSGGDMERQFKSESKRLTSDDEEMERLFEKFKSEFKRITQEKKSLEKAVAVDKVEKPEKDEKFSLEKALYPEESLFEICKSLGLTGKNAKSS